ncbi:hypothetical protein ESCO_001980 [Escovopsis weberi]|uniref:CFEM domain-containing protein n=1 Tax=Escovopsis weberi TaxID=150374 RepID=A0A0M9VWM8_ESCWE|nr:hypothetical protein ESCO_001980 [Escovopsis weberi]
MKLSIVIGLFAILAHADSVFGEDAARGGKKGHKDKEVKEVKLKKIPHCSLECLNNAMAKAGCGATDYACGCANFAGLKKKAAGCVLKKCGIHTARRKVLPAVKALCKNQKMIEQKIEEEYKRKKQMSEQKKLAESTELAEATPLPEADEGEE